MKEVTIHQAREELDELIEAVANGEIVRIIDDQQRIVELTWKGRKRPANAGPRTIGGLEGTIWMAEDFDAPLDEMGR
jgi:antitoxin (DNA-binding transcriptional repressor) of toxin-antitoxin stability system